ncbi:MAG: hydrogenase subunit MbhD domain-containing protein [Caldilineaceae bacterium]
MTIIAAGLLVVRPFWGETSDAHAQVHEASWQLWLEPLLLATMGLLTGVAAGMMGRGLIAPAVAAVAGEAVTVKLALWHGINPMLLLSILTVCLGIAGYWWHDHLVGWAQRLQYRIRGAGGELCVAAQWDVAWRLLADPLLATWLSTRYLLLVVLTGVGLVGFTLASRVGLPNSVDFRGVRLYETVVVGLMVGATAIVVTTASRLTAIVALGVVGLGMTLLFMLLSAPDFAITQLPLRP